jgi:hypothetical protein
VDPLLTPWAPRQRRNEGSQTWNVWIRQNDLKRALEARKDFSERTSSALIYNTRTQRFHLWLPSMRAFGA